MKAWKWIIKMPGGALVRTAFSHAYAQHAQQECNNYPGGVIVGIDLSTASVY
jgi:hypothetical protein